MNHTPEQVLFTNDTCPEACAMFDIQSILSEPLQRVPSVHCAPGARGVIYTHLPILDARVDALPDGVDAVIIAADLQAYESIDPPVEERRLLGFTLIDEVLFLSELGLLPKPHRIGVFLAGDLYAVPTLDKRGGLGDVDAIWLECARRFAWVVGVAGNHDSFAGQTDFETLELPANATFLHGDVIESGGAKIAGISGIVGSSQKPWRVSRSDWTRRLERIMHRKPDVLILHQGPEHHDLHLQGLPWINEQLGRFDHSPLVICGHSHWTQPLATIPEGHTVLNVDYRCVVLRA